MNNRNLITDVKLELRNFSARITAAREKAGYNQTELAKIVGIGKSAMSEYENGKNTPGTKTVAKLAKALDVSIEWLMTGNEYDKVYGYKELSDKQLRLIDLIKNMSDEDLEKFETLINLCFNK
jgi:transcriptional regulator with XRE-family HTH domain